MKMKNKKKLQLGKLNVKSFKTNEQKEIVGGNTQLTNVPTLDYP